MHVLTLQTLVAVHPQTQTVDTEVTFMTAVSPPQSITPGINRTYRLQLSR